jgi:hypothetical protein
MHSSIRCWQRRLEVCRLAASCDASSSLGIKRLVGWILDIWVTCRCGFNVDESTPKTRGVGVDVWRLEVGVCRRDRQSVAFEEV